MSPSPEFYLVPWGAGSAWLPSCPACLVDSCSVQINATSNGAAQVPASVAAIAQALGAEVWSRLGLQLGGHRRRRRTQAPPDGWCRWRRGPLPKNDATLHMNHTEPRSDRDSLVRQKCGAGLVLQHRRRRGREQHATLLPVLARELQRFAISGPSGATQLFGIREPLVMLVGTVEAASFGYVIWEFILNDCTSRVAVKHFVHSASSEPPCLREGEYVRIVGSLQFSSSVRVLSRSVRAVESPDEVGCHIAEALHAQLRLGHPPSLGEQGLR